MPAFQLPTNEKNLVMCLNAEMDRAESEALMRRVRYEMIDHYMDGKRLFRSRDPKSGYLDVGEEDYKGDLNFKLEKLLNQYQMEMGRYMQLDITPMATRKGFSLSAVRKAAAVNAIFTDFQQKVDLDALKSDSLKPFLRYGMVGFGYYYKPYDKQRPHCIEVIPPHQLRGIPARTRGSYNMYGLARKRWVPLMWVRDSIKKMYDKDVLKNKTLTDLKAKLFPWGSVPTDPERDQMDGVPTLNPPKHMTDVDKEVADRIRRTGETEDGVEYVPLEEMYFFEDGFEFLSRYIIKIGETIPFDEDYQKIGRHTRSPLILAKHTDIGRFHARGYVEPKIPLNDALEKMSGSLLKNIKDLDVYGTLMYPLSSGIDPKRWDAGARPRHQGYEPDPLVPESKPFALTPVNAGTLPGDVARFMNEMLTEVSGQGPMFEGKGIGRMDATSGYNFMYDVANLNMAEPVNSYADALSRLYRKVIEIYRDNTSSGSPLAKIALNAVDISLIGLVVDPESGEVALNDKMVPDPSEVKVDIKDRQPRDEETRERKLREGLAEGTVSLERYWITAFQEGLEIPGAPREQWEAYRKAIWNIVMLFGDGETPNMEAAKVGADTVNADIALIPIQELMNSPEFSLASEAVKRAFVTWKMQLEQIAGNKYPEQLPDVSVLAQQAQQQQAMQMQMGSGGPPM